MRKLLFLVLAPMLCRHAPAQMMSQLWSENCASCHGERAEGGGAGTRSLLTDDRRAAELDRPFFDAIKHGVPESGMEPFGAVLDDPKIWGLVVHIRELQARDLRRRVGKPSPTEGVYKTKLASYRIEPVIGSGLDVPWAVDWLPDGTMLVTERPGNVRLVKDGKLGEPLIGTPKVRNAGQGGMLDVAVHPLYDENGWVYLAFSDPLGRNAFTKVVRGKIHENRWTDEQTIFRAQDEHYHPGGGVHFGCHIVFDGKGHIYFGIGERGHSQHAQDLSRPNGKVYRVHEDGSIPKDNPFVGQPSVYEAIWSYGHRNPQGLAFDLKGNLWDTEHGPRGGDELNIIEKGRNYGWPLVSFGINYNNSAFRTPWAGPEQDIRMPVGRWLPSIGACGLDVVRSGPFKAWEGDLLAGGLSGRNIDRVRLAQESGSWQVVEREEVLFDKGRVRDVRCGPDGLIYVVLNDPDQVVRLVPAAP